MAIGGGIVVLALFVWGFVEQSRANREGVEIMQLLRRAAGKQ